MAKKLPAGHHTITPGMVVPGVARLIEFLKQAFDGREVARYEGPGGHIMHAEIQIGDSVVMMGDPMPGYDPMPCMLSLYVDDVDGTYQRALAKGATSLEAPADQFYGHRVARIQDPSGNKWSIHTVIEDISEDEMQRRIAQMGQG